MLIQNSLAARREAVQNNDKRASKSMHMRQHQASRQHSLNSYTLTKTYSLRLEIRGHSTNFVLIKLVQNCRHLFPIGRSRI
jgi:hypothetical protein